MKRKVILLGVLTLALAGSTLAYAGSCLNCHVRPAPVPVVVTNYGVFYGVFSTIFADKHVGWAYGYVNGDGYVHVIKEVRDPLKPEPIVNVIEDDVEGFFKKLEDWITGHREKHKLELKKACVCDCGSTKCFCGK